MDSTISEVMTDFLLQENVISHQQHRFIKGCSTFTNLLHCVSDWTMDLDNHRATDIVYLDFSKAFDKVPKKRLLYKIEQLGLPKIVDLIDTSCLH